MMDGIVNQRESEMWSSFNSDDFGGLRTPKPRFLASFLVDARGGSLRGSRHSGVHVFIPAGKVCMPTRITCKLIKSDKLSSPPRLKEGEAIVSRVLELGPVSIQFNGPVLIELPHIASLHGNEREVTALRSEDGVTWREHPAPMIDVVSYFLKSGLDEIDAANKPSFSIVTGDFPRYFVLISRVRQLSRMISDAGGNLNTDAVRVTFPAGSVTKDTKVGLQVLPVSSETIELVLGTDELSIGASPVVTVEPRRRRFHQPIGLTIPLPKSYDNKRTNASTGPGLHLLYSITSGVSPSEWEDITGSAPMNVVKDCVSISTTVSARFWLVDVGEKVATDMNGAEIVSHATRVYKEAVSVPIMAHFVVFVRRHHENEAQLRILCITDDAVDSTTLECQEKFHKIARSDPVELLEGKSYCVKLSGNLVPASASVSQLGLEFRAFRVNRLSFVVRVRDGGQLPSGLLEFLPAVKLLNGVEPQAGVVVCKLQVSLVEAKTTELTLDHEPEELARKFEVAMQQAAQDDQVAVAGSSVTLKLSDIAAALQSDWLSLAKQLGITDAEVIKIQKDFGNIVEQAMIMLHLWLAKAGRADSRDLENALKRIGREDIINKCISSDSAESHLKPELTNGHEEAVLSIDHPVDESSYHTALSTEPYLANDQKTAVFEESPVYQIEEVWDGTQWHKSMKIVPTAGDTNLEEGVSVSVVASDPNNEHGSENPGCAEPESQIEYRIESSPPSESTPSSTVMVRETTTVTTDGGVKETTVRTVVSHNIAELNDDIVTVPSQIAEPTSGSDDPGSVEPEYSIQSSLPSELTQSSTVVVTRTTTVTTDGGVEETTVRTVVSQNAEELSDDAVKVPSQIGADLEFSPATLESGDVSVEANKTHEEAGIAVDGSITVESALTTKQQVG